MAPQHGIAEPSAAERLDGVLGGMPAACLVSGEHDKQAGKWRKREAKLRRDAERPPESSSPEAPAPEPAAVTTTSGISASRRSISRTIESVCSRRVPGGVSTEAQIWRGAVSGKNSMPALKAAKSASTATKEASVAPSTTPRWSSAHSSCPR